ncbi:MAG TPA: hypothetical protein VFQ43_21975, partial [Nitrososphaera sp.]|nr:hypothetical protein [Nitrososphaera sp.]
MKRNGVAQLLLHWVVYFFVGLVIPSGAEAQNKPTTKTEEVEKSQSPSEKREQVQKIFEIKHADIDQLADVLR